MLTTIFQAEIREPSVDIRRRTPLGVKAGGKKQNSESHFAENPSSSSSLFWVHKFSFHSHALLLAGWCRRARLSIGAIVELKQISERAPRQDSNRNLLRSPGVVLQIRRCEVDVQNFLAYT